jgi:hypothetical protein
MSNSCSWGLQYVESEGRVYVGDEEAARKGSFQINKNKGSIHRLSASDYTRPLSPSDFRLRNLIRQVSGSLGLVPRNLSAFTGRRPLVGGEDLGGSYLKALPTSRATDPANQSF